MISLTLEAQTSFGGEAPYYIQINPTDDQVRYYAQLVKEVERLECTYFSCPKTPNYCLLGEDSEDFERELSISFEEVKVYKDGILQLVLNIKNSTKEIWVEFTVEQLAKQLKI